MVYDSLKQSPFLGFVHRLNFKQSRRFGSRICFRLQAKKHLIWWAPWIELHLVCLKLRRWIKSFMADLNIATVKADAGSLCDRTALLCASPFGYSHFVCDRTACCVLHRLGKATFKPNNNKLCS